MPRLVATHEAGGNDRRARILSGGEAITPYAALTQAAFLLTAPIASLTGAHAAGDDWLAVTVGSRHHKRGYNEHNYGIGVEHGLSESWRAVGGFYRNSFYRDTVYIGATYVPLRLGDWRFGGTVLYASGYEARPVFIPFPLISYEQKEWGLNIGPLLPTVVGFQVKFKID